MEMKIKIMDTKILILTMVVLGVCKMASDDTVYHLEKSKDLFSSFGIAFKYTNEFFLASNKLTKKAGLLTTSINMESNGVWDLITTIRIDGNLNGKRDGIVINLSRQNVQNTLFEYQTDPVDNFGFPRSISGAYVVLTRPSVEEGFLIQANAFDNVEQLEPNKALNQAKFGGHDVYQKEKIVLARGKQEIKIYFRYKNGVLKLYYALAETKKPELLTTFKDIALKDFYITMSAAIKKNPATITIPNLYFKSDKVNPDIKFFTNHGQDKIPDVFKFIHLMHDIHTEHESNEDPDFDIKSLRKRELLEKILNNQRITQYSLKPAESIFDASQTEISLVFNYMEHHSDMTNLYFKKVLGEVSNMLSSAKRNFNFMKNDIGAIVKGFKKNQIATHIKKSHDKLHSLIERLQNVEKSLSRTSKKARDLKRNLHRGHKFMDKYESIFSNMPEKLRIELDKKAKNAANLMNKILRWFFILLFIAVVVGFAFIFKFINDGGSKQVLL